MAWSQSVAFAGGTAGTTAYGAWDRITFAGSWTAGKFWTIAVTIGSVAQDLNLGAGSLLQDTSGNFVALAVTYLMTLADRVYAANGSQLNFSANNAPTLWDQFDVDSSGNTGAGAIAFLSGFGQQDSLNSLASFQGRIALIFRYRVELWNYDADPANFSRAQILMNVGTGGPFSVANLGDLDVIFLDDAGVRSLRALVTTLNASPVSIGSPIDQTIIDATLGGATPSSSCAVVEPLLKQYWLYYGGYIYILSYFPEAKVTAWARFNPVPENSSAYVGGTFDGNGSYSYTGFTTLISYKVTSLGNATSLVITNQGTPMNLVVGDTFMFLDATDTLVATGPANTGVTTAITAYNVGVYFAPVKFVVYLGQVFMLSSETKIYSYGSTDRNTFDHCPSIVETPWLDAKQPTGDKNFTSVDLALSGRWAVAFGNDPISGTMRWVLVKGNADSPDGNKDSTYDVNTIPFEGPGTHFKFKAVRMSGTKAKISSVTAHFTTGDSH